MNNKLRDEAASEVQVSYDLAREDKDLTCVTVSRVFENGFKVLLHLQGDDAEAFIDAWNGRPTSPLAAAHRCRYPACDLINCECGAHPSANPPADRGRAE